jgi:ATP-dependent DNA helicase RecG
LDTLQFQNLVRQLISLPKETEWLELKHNNDNPYETGEYISALSNTAALLGKHSAYILWGIDDSTHETLGTTFRPRETNVKGQELESWLIFHLDPQIDLRIHEGKIEGKYVVLFEFAPAPHRPIRFNGTEYIRIGSYKKKLHDCPEKERELWRVLGQTTFEKGLAMKSVPVEHVLTFIDCPAYFQLMKLPYPENRSAVLQRMISERLIIQSDDGGYDITNLGAILFAKNLEDFERLARKTLRIIFYHGDSRIDTIKEYEMKKGYALGFEDVVSYINDQLPLEFFQLPAPDFRKTTQSTLAVLYGPREFKNMDSKERIRAAYQHACLQHVIGEKMTNESLRNRLGINQSSYPLASRIIRDAIMAELVKPQGDEVGIGKSATYLPFWA